ncbi:peptidyl-tRNA hydrolase [Mycena sp. CBHHK59/15]|nr:peptidyl-tRNA hydrolase [Mycena sp. CBHHK59/15]
MSIPRVLVAGLGNLPYPGTRHSLGQLIVDGLAARTGIRMSAERGGFSGTGTVTLGETRVALKLYKSKQLMNVSGPSMAAAFRAHGQPDALVVISDSTDHAPCVLKYRFGGSAGGHNGLKSVIGALGAQGFHRLRAGVGQHPGMDLADYVLGRLSAHEKQFWAGEGLDRVCEAIEKVARTVEGGNSMRCECSFEL